MAVNQEQCLYNFGLWRRFRQGAQYPIDPLNIFAGNTHFGVGERAAG